MTTWEFMYLSTLTEISKECCWSTSSWIAYMLIKFLFESITDLVANSLRVVPRWLSIWKIHKIEYQFRTFYDVNTM